MWTYNNKEINQIPEGYIGFVYRLTLPNGIMYIGKKQFTFKAYKQVNKKRKRFDKESNWKEYYGSSDWFNEQVELVGKENVKREILKLCKTKSDESYWETWYIFTEHALLKDNYANGWVSCKIHKKNVFGKIVDDSIYN
jgi:hypothetical protein